MINGTKLPFSPLSFVLVPDALGVYALWDESDLIYYGQGQLRTRLQAHHSGSQGPCTKGATTFQYEQTIFAVSRERELIQEYVDLYRVLPRCNDVMP